MNGRAMIAVTRMNAPNSKRRFVLSRGTGEELRIEKGELRKGVVGGGGSALLRDAGKRGAVLLEVILSIGLLVFGMAVVGIQVSTGLQAARIVDIDTRAMMLVDTLLAELDSGLIQTDINDDHIKGNFLNQAPGFTWRIWIKKADVQNLYMLTVDIGYNEKQVQSQIEDPAMETSIEDDGVKIVQTVYRLYPVPADIDMERDYGLTSEDMKSLFGGSTGKSGGGSGTEGGQGGGDQAAGDLAQMASDMGIDLTQFSFLFEGGGFDPRQLSKLPEDQFMQLAALLQVVMAQGGTAIKDFEKQGGVKKLEEEAKKSGQQSGE